MTAKPTRKKTPGHSCTAANRGVIEQPDPADVQAANDWIVAGGLARGGGFIRGPSHGLGSLRLCGRA